MSVWQVLHHPRMGRTIVTHDPRSRSYPAAALLSAGAPRKTRTWRRPAAYDQGQTSTCVGQTFRGLLNTLPTTKTLSTGVRAAYDANAIYRGAQDHDQWPGPPPAYDGTSALGAGEYLRSVGLITGYHWCFSLDDALDVLSQHGAVGIGVNWRSDMWNTDASGFVHPTGAVVGGHEVELHGIDVPGKYVIGTNSWGTSWGLAGRFKLTWDDLGTLLADGGDAVTLTVTS